MENVVQELRLEIVKPGNNIKEDCAQKINILDRDIKALRYDINQLSKNIKSTALLLNKLNDKETLQTHDINEKPVTMETMTTKKGTLEKIKDGWAVTARNMTSDVISVTLCAQRMKHL